jgi:LacI family transcriptional regulator
MDHSKEKRLTPPRRVARRITLKDVAEKTGVSINTVSAVLNDRTTQVRVSEGTRQRIIESAAELGYRRNLAASLLAGGRTKTLGILLDNLANLFAAPVAQGFEEEAALRGYQCFLGCTQYNGLRKVEYINRFLEHHVEGLLLIGVWLDPDVEKALKSALSTETRLMAVDVPWQGHAIPTVCGDHYRGGYLLGEHLVREGHEHVCYLGLPEVLAMNSVEERIRGFRDSIRQLGQGKCRFSLFDTAGHTEKTLADAALKAIGQPDRPTVLAVSHDTHAFLVINGLRGYGIEVPRDIAITGFDDIQYEIFRPFGGFGLENGLYPITTVRQPVSEIGRLAAELLIESIESPGSVEPEIHRLGVELVVRESSRYCHKG